MKLYIFPHSPYARKIQIVLDLIGVKYTSVDVPYSDRSELVALTGGYVHVPVLEDDGAVIFDSRKIAEHLIARRGGAALVPPGSDGPIWAYADWVDGPLEDILFRIASPSVRDRWATANDRALYTIIKERKFGTGCVDAWHKSRAELIDKGRALLAPTARTLAQRPFIMGDRPTLADATLYGQFGMLSADPSFPPAALGEPFPAWMARVAAERKTTISV